MFPMWYDEVSLAERATALLYWTCMQCGARIGNGDWHACSKPAPVLSGWQCPKCGRVWGPQVEGCSHCNAQEETRE